MYFTPKSLRDVVFEHVPKNPCTVLEPSFGSGEFLFDARTLWPNARIVGVELDRRLFDSVHGFETYCSDFLKWTCDTQFNVIIGNPPYVVTQGRGNLFVDFILKCLQTHLVPGGTLAFVLPTSFYNCAYYLECREYIRDHCTVTWCSTVNGKFLDTAQTTSILVIEKHTVFYGPLLFQGDDYATRSPSS